MIRFRFFPLLFLCIIAGALSYVRAETASSLPVFQDGKSFLALDVTEAQRKQFGGLPLDPLADFSRVFEAMTGVVLGEPLAGKAKLRIEFLPANADSPLASLPVGIRETASEISVTPEGVTIRGETPAGISGGLYKILEDWGNRWVLPGPLGEVIPKHNALSLPLGTNIVQIGSDTGFGAYSPESMEWVQRNRLLQATWLPCFHYWRYGVEPDKYFASHPEYYALVDGERKPTQVETTNPEVIRLKVEHAKKFFRANPHARTYPMDPEDNGEFSESPESLAIDPPGTTSKTDRVVNFANAVLQGFREEFPAKSVGFYSYFKHSLPPVREKVDPSMTVGVTRFGYCTLRMTPTPNTPSPEKFETLVRDWLKLTPNVYVYEYNPPSWGGALPFPNYLDMAESMRRLHKMGVRGFYSDSTHIEHAPGVFINSYLRRRMMVDPKQDPQALLEDFTRSFFGPAAQAMRDYYETLAQVTSSYKDPARPNLGVSIYRLEEIFPRDLVARATKKLDHALKTPGLDEMQRKRIEYVKLGHDYLVHYLAAIDAAKAGNYEAAKTAFDKTFRQIALQERVSPSKFDDTRTRMEAARSTTLATYFPKEQGMITDWKILGPIPRKELDRKTEAAILAQMTPTPVTIGGKTFTWQPYASQGGLLDFNQAFHRSGLEVPSSKVFASACVEVPEATTATAYVSGFYPFTVFLNGKKVFNRDGPNFDWPDRNSAQVTLHKGTNHFVFLSDEMDVSTRENPMTDGFDWSLSLGLRDQQGLPLSVPVVTGKKTQ
ncbi:MAG: DUF4838 domain-containing protein [Chthoniobacterales bacterium]|nr:DUF4838 domain-containing protein [Chthoniobacterales bacterium]